MAIRTLPGRLATGRMNKRESAVLGSFAKNVARASFAADGSSTSLELDVVIPAGSIITEVHSNITTTISGNSVTDFNLSDGSNAIVDESTNLAAGVYAETVDALVVQSADVKLTMNFEATEAAAAPTAGAGVILITFIGPDAE